jgi:hypothetical protein
VTPAGCGHLSSIFRGVSAKGLIYAPEHGIVAFTVLGMSGFIQRQRRV